MTLVQFLPAMAGVLFIAFAAYCVAAAGTLTKHAWLFPAALSAAFLFFSLTSVLVEGPLAFWTEHTRNLWGNQIWFDLLLAGATSWYFLVPRARAAGMRLFPWLMLVVGTGSIGLLAMVARLLFLQSREAENGRRACAIVAA